MNPSRAVHTREHLPFLGLRGKLLIAFVGLALVPLTLVAIYGRHAAGDALRAASASHVDLQLQSAVESVGATVSSLAREAGSLARVIGEATDGPLGEALSPRLRSRFEGFAVHTARSRPDLEQVRLLSTSGRELVRVDRREGALAVVPTDELQDKSDRYYFQEALEGSSGLAYVSPMDLNVERGFVEEPHRLVFRVAHSVRSQGLEPLGVVVLNVGASEILRRMDALRPSPGADLMLADQRGRYVRESCDGGDCVYAFGDLSRDPGTLTASARDAFLAGQVALVQRSGPTFVSYAPVHVAHAADPSSWRVAIHYPESWLLAPVSRMARQLYRFAAAVGVVALTLGLLAAASLRRPIERTLHYLGAVAKGQTPPPLRIRTRDELEVLATRVVDTSEALASTQARLEHLNEELQQEVEAQVSENRHLLESKHTLERQLHRADRLASLGLLSASLAHEVGNPLASMKTVIQVRQREAGMSPGTREDLELVLAEIDRLVEILDRVRGFVQPVRAEQVSISVAEVYRRVDALVEREASAAGVVIALSGDSVDVPLHVEGGKLEQVLLNVIVNALQALEGAGTIELTASRTNRGLAIEVRDDGPGMDDDALGRAFEPFYTSKPGGTGLGLPIVRKIVTELGGTTHLESSPGDGLTVRVVLPPELLEGPTSGLEVIT